MGRYFDPLTDWSFKRLFGGEPGKEILIEFLNDLFAGEKVITDLVYGPGEHNGPASDKKKVVFDLFCTGNKGEKFIVEMQRGRQDFFRERSVFYTSRVVSDQLPAGMEHFSYDIPEVYLIAILEFRMDKEPSEQYFHNICLMDRDSKEIFYKKLGYKFLELPNFTKEAEDLETDVEKWTYLLKNMSRLDQIPVYLNKRIFQRIFQIAEISNLTPEEQTMYEASLKDKWDYENVLATAMRESELKGELKGKLEGRLEGELKAKLETAREMKAAGLSISQIAQFTKLSVEEINKL